MCEVKNSVARVLKGRYRLLKWHWLLLYRLLGPYITAGGLYISIHALDIVQARAG